MDKPFQDTLWTECFFEVAGKAKAEGKDTIMFQDVDERFAQKAKRLVSTIEKPDRLCPHDEMHDRIRQSMGYMRDGEGDDKSVCALCWLEADMAFSDRFHSPHGCVVTMLFSMLKLKRTE